MKILAIVMITYNEEFHIGDCIDNIRDIADEIFVLDSLSSDKTVEIALSKGATVLQRPFTNFGDQWNFALKAFPIESKYTMKIDPDERLSDELKKNIIEEINKGEFYSFSLYRRLWFMARPINVKQKILRVWKTGSCHFCDNIVNEFPIVEGGKHKLLTGYMEHLDSSDLFKWNEKQNRYTTMEAIQLYKYKKNKSNRAGGLKEFIKYNIYGMPFCFTFLHLYHLIGKRTIFNGKEGRAWARLRTEIYRMRYYKYLEMKNTKQIPNINSRKEKGIYNEEVLKQPLQQAIMLDNEQ